MILLAAVYVSLGRGLVKIAPNYQSEVEANLSSALGVPVTTEKLEGGWSLFSPQLIVHGLQIGEGENALYIERLFITPDVVSSLLTRKLKVAELALDNLQLTAIQDDSGAWRLQGLSEKEGGADVTPVLQALQKIDRLSLFGGRLTVLRSGKPDISFSYMDFTLRNTSGKTSLDVLLNLPDGKPFSLHAQMDDWLENWRTARIHTYFRMPQTDWADWIPEELFSDWSLKHLSMEGEVWMDWRQGQLRRVATRVKGASLQAQSSFLRPLRLQDISGVFYFWTKNGKLSFSTTSLSFSLEGERWQDLGFSLLREGDRWTLMGDRLDLHWIELAVLKLPLPIPDKGIQIIRALKLEGALLNYHAVIHPPLDRPDALIFEANLENVGIRGFEDVPAVEHVNGAISGNLESGNLRLNTRDFGLHLTKLFPRMWRWNTAKARLDWRWKDNVLTLYSPLMQVEAPEGKATGDLLIRVSPDDSYESSMDLRIGLVNGDARFTSNYVPIRSPKLNPDLGKWLNSAIRQGAIDAGIFQFHGALGKTAHQEDQGISLYFKVRDAELAYLDGWPAVKAARGEVNVEHYGVHVQVPEGRIENMAVRDIVASVPLQDSDLTVPVLDLRADFEGELQEAVGVLQTVPASFAASLKGWSATGSAGAKLHLSVPMKKGTEPVVQVSLTTENAGLQMALPHLDISQISGRAEFDSRNGVSSDALSARLFDMPVKGRFSPAGSGKNVVTRLQASGTMDTARLLKWLKLKPDMFPVTGSFPYQVSVEFSSGKNTLKVDSSLRGLSVNLPAPLGKKRDEIRDSHLAIDFGSLPVYRFQYGRIADFAMVGQPGSSQARAALQLGGATAVIPKQLGLQINGSLANLDSAVWQRLYEGYAGKMQGSFWKDFFRSANVTLESLDLMGMPLHWVTLNLFQQNNHWQLNLSGEQVRGSLTMPVVGNAPWVINLDRLVFPEWKSRGKSTASLSNVLPPVLPPMDVNIHQLLMGNELWGRASFQSRPVSQGVAFTKIDAEMRKLSIRGTLHWTAIQNKAESRFVGSLAGGNIGQVLKVWGYAPSLTSEKFRVNINGQWPGSPADPSLETFTGSLYSKFTKGQLVEVQGSGSALRVFGLLNFNAIGQRLRLDFSDMFHKGLAYDELKGGMKVKDGYYVTDGALELRGPSSAMEMQGGIDMRSEQIDARLNVTLPVSNNLPIAAVAVGAPIVGGALLVLDKLAGDKFSRLSRVQYRVTGSWYDPSITFDKPF